MDPNKILPVKMEHFLPDKLYLPDELALCYCARDENLKPGVRYGPVIRDIYVVECCTDGKGSVIVNGKEFPVRKGDCYILMPGDTVIHTADSVDPRSGVFCFIDGMRIGDCLRRAGITSEQPFAPPEAFPAICQIIEHLLEKKENDPGADMRRSGSVCHLLGELLRFAPGEEYDPQIVRKALRIMEARFDQTLSVSDIAGEVGMDRSWFSTVFKTHTGLSPYDYLSRLRIKKACSLLKQTDCSVSVVAGSVGIDAENFSRVFKKYMGITPGTYRKTR